MAVSASRTFAKVKSSAMTPRQPEVPNLTGEGMLHPARVLMARYFSLSRRAEKVVNMRGPGAIKNESRKSEKRTNRSRDLPVARASDGQVTRTIRAFLTFARLIFYCSRAPHINDFFRTARKAKITRHEHTRWMEHPFSGQVWHFGLARGHCRRFHLRKRTAGADGHRGTREGGIRRAHNPRRLRYALLFRRVFAARRGHPRTSRRPRFAVRNVHADARRGLRNHAAQAGRRRQLHCQRQPGAI